MTEVAVSRLTRRLADTPQDFLADPDTVAVPAVVSDLLLMAGGATLTAQEAARFEGGKRKWRQLVLVTSWLLADPLLLTAGPKRLLHWLTATNLAELAHLMNPAAFVQDPDRREELARLTLRALSITAHGETKEQAADRLSTVDSVQRQKVLRAAREAQKRAEQVRKAMEEQRAREAAARYSQV